MAEYIFVQSDCEYEEASVLFKEYADSLNIDLSFQKFSEELLHLKIMYATPYGGIILAKEESYFIGCIALRKIDNETAELKRMYIKPAYRNKRIGIALLNCAISLAMKYNYKKIRLDTLSNMVSAINLYKNNGFYEIPAYYYNPEKNALYFEKILE